MADIKMPSQKAEIDFSKPILAVDDEPLTEFDRKLKQDVPVTIGRVLGNVLFNFRPQPDPQRGQSTEFYDAIRAVELAREIYRAKVLGISGGDIDFILEVLNKIPLSSPGVEEALKSTLRKARASIK